jgi:Zn-dependent protease with chaperone function
MDFFARQERSRRTTRFLVVMFLIAVLVITFATTAVTGAIVRLYASNPAAASMPWPAWSEEHAFLLLAVAAGTLGFIALASLYRTASLAGGGGQVARLLGATEITGEGSDPLRRRLVNVVEEMAIASGLPVPEIYVLEQEPGINAFAAGLTHADAAIAVTRGALERLDRSELQGVIAHEFSHILNGDMRLNQQLIGLAFGILVLSLMGRWLMRAVRFTRRGRNNGVAAVVGLGIALIVIGAIGVFFSRLIKAAVSRQREALADASAVQFTRDPSGLADALKKIGGYTSHLSSTESEEVAHMLFERGSRAFSGWFATHPPLIERIRALDPGFDPADYPLASGPVPGTSPAEAEPAPGPVHALAQARPPGPSGDPLEHAGRIEAPAVGGALRASVPPDLYPAAHDREASLLLVLALAISPVAAARARQLRLIESQLGAERAGGCRKLREAVQRLDEDLWLPLLELSLPALKQRPGEQLDYLFELVEKLVAMDERERLFDYVLVRMLAAYLREAPGAALRGKPPAKLSSEDALVSMLTIVAAFGHESSASARAAYRAGIASLGEPPKRYREPVFEPLAEARNLSALDAAIQRLSRLRPTGKRRVLNAVLTTIRHDRRTDVAEVELFRAISATLGCPLPPQAARARAENT